MCGRFAIKEAIEKLATFYQTVKPAVQFNGNYNVSPTEQVPIVVERPDKERDIVLAQFGMPMEINGKKFPLLNLQSEKAGNREDFNKRRCIIPANGFFEWEKITPKEKQPYYFSPNEGLFSFAGVWRQGTNGNSFTIFTTSANDVVGHVHPRMPVILSHNAMGQWLEPDAPKDTLISLMQPFPDGLMQSWKVSKAVNSPKNKEAACINSL